VEAFPELASEEMNPVEVTDEMREKMRASQRKEEKERREDGGDETRPTHFRRFRSSGGAQSDREDPRSFGQSSQFRTVQPRRK